MTSGEGSGSPGADQSLQDMAASWQPLIDQVAQRRQAAESASAPERRGSPWSIRIRNPFHRNQPTREPGTRVEPIPPPNPAVLRSEPALTPERRRWYQSLGATSWEISKNWAINLGPLGKDKAWLIGMGVGAGIGVASNFLVAPGVDRLILSGVKLAASQAIYTGIKGFYAYERTSLIGRGHRAQASESEINTELERVERRRSRAEKFIRSFGLGMSAGATYTSITGIGLGAAEHFLGARLPNVNVGAIAEKVVNKVKETKMPEVGVPEVKLEMPNVRAGIKEAADNLGNKIQELTGTGEPPVAPDAATGAGEVVVGSKQALEALTQTADYQNAIAASVGNHLDLTDQAVNEAIKNMGVDPAKVSKQAFEHARQMAQHQMEANANNSFNPANYKIDFSAGPISPSMLKEQFAQDFNSYMSDSRATSYLRDIASGGLRESLTAEIVSSDPFKLSVAAAVGAHLDTVTSNTINEVLAAKGLDPSKLSPEALQKIHEALRHQMENYANYQFENAASDLVSGGFLDTPSIASRGNSLFVDFLNSQDAHNQLVALASKTLNDNIPIDLPVDLPTEQFLTGNIQKALSSLSPTDLAERVIPGNTTVGHMLFEAGVQTGWGADQAQLFGAEIAANHELLSAAWAANEHTPFPIEIGVNLQNLIERAQDGDAAALQKLKNALRWIPEGARFKILNKAGVSAVLAAFYYD